MVASMSAADLDKLTARIQALRAKTLDNGCTEAEAFAAAAKVAELLDRYDLSLSDVELRAEPCAEAAFETNRKKRIPIDECIGAIAQFCDCAVWREKTPLGFCHVFFGLKADAEVAQYLADVVDAAVRTELGRYKNSAAYQRFPHKERHLANGSFTLGMVASIADRLLAMKAARDDANRGSGRDLVPVKSAIVEAELAKRGLQFRSIPGARRYVSPEAYDAGSTAGEALALNPGIGKGA
jgi:hypothetical protein